ncbi:MAG: hypothetical protein ACLSHV_03425 [Hominisplanchenecus sp.]
MILAGEIEEMIVQRGGKHLESCQTRLIFTKVLRSKQVINLWLTPWYSVQKTRHMEESEITAAMKKILEWSGSYGNRDFVSNLENNT